MSTIEIIPTNSHLLHSESRPKSPAAPSYSPITPKASVVFPVASSSDAAFVRPPEDNTDNNDDNYNDNNSSHEFNNNNNKSDSTMISHPARFIPQPPNLPFSAHDSSDAIALRAAISALQFQKQKAQSDLKTLESLKKLALVDPEHFTAELKAGRLKEAKPGLSSLRPFVEGEEDSEEEEEEEEEKEEDGQEPAVLGAEREDEKDLWTKKKSLSPPPRTEIPDSQPSRPSSKDGLIPTKFPKIPGAQDVVRTPYINWAKYGIVGAPLDSMHAQQQRWPGSTNFTSDRGREYSIAAPYSPFHDELQDREAGEDTRRDSGPRPSLTGTISEHVMSTRSRV